MDSRHNDEVDEYIEKLSHPQKEEIIRLREIILKSSPAITEHIKWNAPSFCINGDDRITMNLQPGKPLRIIFHRGAKVKDSKDFQFEDSSKLIKWLAKDRGQIELHDINELNSNENVLKNLVDKWIKETA